MSDIPKTIKDGKVAVVVSRGFGASFSASMLDPDNQERALFDPTIVALVQQGATWDKIRQAAELLYGSEVILATAVSRLEVVWLPEGTSFLISEYDGAEYIVSEDDLNYKA